MTHKQALRAFLNQFTLDDIKSKVIGELNEHSIGDFTCFYGNGELILVNDDSSWVYVVDNVRGFDELTIYCAQF